MCIVRKTSAASRASAILLKSARLGEQCECKENNGNSESRADSLLPLPDLVVFVNLLILKAH